MKNTQLDKELLNAIENIGFTEYESMVESTCALLEMYDKQLDIIEETTVPDELFISEFAIFQEADDSADKKDEKEENWFVRNIGNTRFGDSAGEKQKLFGRKTKNGAKEKIIVGVLLLVPRLIAGLINKIRDHFSKKSKEDKKETREKANAIADACAKNEATVTQQGGKVRISLNEADYGITSKPKKDKSAPEDSVKSDEIENQEPIKKEKESEPKSETKDTSSEKSVIEIPVNTFKRLKWLSDLAVKTDASKLSNKENATKIDEMATLASYVIDGVHKIKAFMANTEHEAYVKEIYGKDAVSSLKSKSDEANEELKSAREQRSKAISSGSTDDEIAAEKRRNDATVKAQDLRDKYEATSKALGNVKKQKNLANQNRQKHRGSTYEKHKDELMNGDGSFEGLNRIAKQLKQFMDGSKEISTIEISNESAATVFKFVGSINDKDGDRLFAELKAVEFDKLDTSLSESNLRNSTNNVFIYDTELMDDARTFLTLSEKFAKFSTNVFGDLVRGEEAANAADQKLAAAGGAGSTAAQTRIKNRASDLNSLKKGKFNDDESIIGGFLTSAFNKLENGTDLPEGVSPEFARNVVAKSADQLAAAKSGNISDGYFGDILDENHTRQVISCLAILWATNNVINDNEQAIKYIKSATEYANHEGIDINDLANISIDDFTAGDRNNDNYKEIKSRLEGACKVVASNRKMFDSFCEKLRPHIEQYFKAENDTERRAEISRIDDSEVKAYMQLLDKHALESVSKGIHLTATDQSSHIDPNTGTKGGYTRP